MTEEKDNIVDINQVKPETNSKTQMRENNLLSKWIAGSSPVIKNMLSTSLSENNIPEEKLTAVSQEICKLAAESFGLPYMANVIVAKLMICVVPRDAASIPKEMTPKYSLNLPSWISNTAPNPGDTLMLHDSIPVLPMVIFRTILPYTGSLCRIALKAMVYSDEDADKLVKDCEGLLGAVSEPVAGGIKI